jgi:hypothetical protein
MRGEGFCTVVNHPNLSISTGTTGCLPVGLSIALAGTKRFAVGSRSNSRNWYNDWGNSPFPTATIVPAAILVFNTTS